MSSTDIQMAKEKGVRKKRERERESEIYSWTDETFSIALHVQFASEFILAMFTDLFVTHRLGCVYICVVYFTHTVVYMIGNCEEAVTAIYSLYTFIKLRLSEKKKERDYLWRRVWMCVHVGERKGVFGLLVCCWIFFFLRRASWDQAVTAVFMVNAKCHRVCYWGFLCWRSSSVTWFFLSHVSRGTNAYRILFPFCWVDWSPAFLLLTFDIEV